MSLIQQLKQAQDLQDGRRILHDLFWNIRRPLKICHPETGASDLYQCGFCDTVLSEAGRERVSGI